MTGQDDRATRTPREVGHRRRTAPTVEDMASPPPIPPAQPHTRVRRGRVLALGGALALTATIAIASLVVPDQDAAAASADPTPGATVAAVLPAVAAASSAPEPAPANVGTKAPVGRPTPTPTPSASPSPAAAVPPPANSGQGRRIVFDQSDQRVWLIEKDGTVDRTYLVSGSKHDNLQPGTYAVQSRQRKAVSFDYSGTMEYFVRFATGRTAPIGFHSIPVFNDGRPEQTVEQLGTALSAGCVRQRKSDAKYLWDWAPDGTTVVVTA